MQYLSLLVIFVSMNVFSQADKGGMGSGGGSGIICFSSKESADFVRSNGGIVPDHLISSIRAIQSLDLQIAFMRKGLSGEKPKLLLAQPGQSLEDYLEVLLIRLNERYIKIGASVREALPYLEKNIYYRINPIKRILDEDDVGSEESDYCTLTNLAAQYQTDFETHIHLDERLFMHPTHNISSKGILLLHEFIYSVLRKDRANNSRQVRSIIQNILED